MDIMSHTFIIKQIFLEEIYMMHYYKRHILGTKYNKHNEGKKEKTYP